MKRVAILGGGPAGAFAAEKLALAGLGVVLMDEKLAWEKPCGGGLTHKAYSQYPFLIENSTPKRLVTESVLSAPNAGEARLKLADPLVIYSRFDRSEEHTSELQSPCNIVCRLLLEKKNKTRTRTLRTTPDCSQCHHRSQRCS